MIVDDRVVVCGSANLNDRSQLGDRDSELAVIINQPASYPSSMNNKPVYHPPLPSPCSQLIVVLVARISVCRILSSKTMSRTSRPSLLRRNSCQSHTKQSSITDPKRV